MSIFTEAYLRESKIDSEGVMSESSEYALSNSPILE